MTREEFLKTFPVLVGSYRPSPESLEHVKNVSLLIIVGPSGVGKSAIIDRLGMPYVPSDVTRQARPEEKNGVDMYFRDDYAQIINDIGAGRFLQVVVGATGDFYASRADSYPTGGWAVMPVVADVVPMFRNLGFRQTITAFIVPPSYQEWMIRIRKPGLSDDEIASRLPEAERSLKFALTDPQMHFILNDRLDEAVWQVKSLINGVFDKQREDQAREVARYNYQALVADIHE